MESELVQVNLLGLTESAKTGPSRNAPMWTRTEFSPLQSELGLPVLAY